MRAITTWAGVTAALCVAVSSSWAATVAGQRARMEDYEKKAKDRIVERLETYRLTRLDEERQKATLATSTVTPSDDQDALEAIRELERPFKSVIDLYDSNSGEGQDLEIRLTMPIDEFMAFAPVAALEAAAIPHKFPVVNIFLREETTDRVARVAFADAEPIAGRYLAQDDEAIEEMKDALIWH